MQEREKKKSNKIDEKVLNATSVVKEYRGGES